MVVASTLSFLFLNDAIKHCSQGQLVDMAMRNERVVGVNSGGMDVRLLFLLLFKSNFTPDGVPPLGWTIFSKRLQ